MELQRVARNIDELTMILRELAVEESLNSEGIDHHMDNVVDMREISRGHTCEGFVYMNRYALKGPRACFKILVLADIILLAILACKAAYTVHVQ